jgi:hypothetical protein
MIFFLAGSCLKAQMTSGYRFGVNLTTMVIKSNGKSINAEVPMGIQFGGMFDTPLAGKLSLYSGFLFSSKGTDYKINNVDYSIAPAYMELPVNCAFNLGRRKTKVSFYAGPYFATAFGGYKIDATEGYKDLLIGRARSNDLRRLDYGINFGTSLKIKGYVFSIQYGEGLRNVSPKSDIGMKNKVIGISFGTLKGQLK